MLSSETRGLDTAHLVFAWILAGLRLQFAVEVIGTLIVRFALWFLDAVALGVYSEAVVNGTNAVAVVVDDETSFEVADAVAVFVDLFALLGWAVDAFLVVVEDGARWTYAFAVRGSYETFVCSAEFHCKIY